MKKDERNHCPVCGWNGLEAPAYAQIEDIAAAHVLAPPYADKLGEPSFQVCLCCGYEYGYHDDPPQGKGISFSSHLKSWMEEGATWFDDARTPDGWRIQDQLRGKKIPEPGRKPNQQKKGGSGGKKIPTRNAGIENE